MPVVAGLLLTTGQIGAAARLVPMPPAGVAARSGPGLGYELMGEVPAGQELPLVAEQEDWLQVRSAGGQLAWVPGWVSRVRYDDTWVYATSGADELHLRTAPEVTATAHRALPPYTQVRVLETAGLWWRVVTASGDIGWVGSPHVTRLTPQIAPAQPPVLPPTDPALLDRPASPAAAVTSLPPAQAGLPAGGKLARARRPETVWQGRNSPLFEKYDTLRTGESLTYLDSVEGWLWVHTPRGHKGWVPGGAVQLTEGDLSYEVSESVWSLASSKDSGLAASLQVTAPGVLTLTVATAAPLLGSARADGRVLVVPVAAERADTAALPVGSWGVEALASAPDGVRLSLTGPPHWQVLEQDSRKVVIVLQPRLDGIGQRRLTDRTIYHFWVTGPVAPRASASGASVQLDLPGTVLAADLVPPGLRVEQAEGGVRVTLNSRQTFGLKPTADGFEVHLYNPGVAGKTILIDPGHGGSDPGAANSAVGVVEKNANLRVALRLWEILSAQGARVLLTRASDRDTAPAELLARGDETDQKYAELGHRTRLANEQAVDAFLSIHHNGNARGIGGTETYYTSTTLNGAGSQRLAQQVQAAMAAALGLNDRGAKDEVYYVTRDTTAPAALAEVAFLDHPAEARQIGTAAFQQAAAQAMARGLAAYFNGRD